MMKSSDRKRRSRIADAEEFILRLAGECRTRGESRLPTIQEISRAGRFSASTVCTALRGLRQTGVVTAVNRTGIVLTGESPATAPAERSTERWQQVRDCLDADLLAAKYPPGALLPGYKGLCRIYGASYPSVRQALTSLVDDGRLMRHRRGVRVRQAAAPKFRSTIMFISQIGSMPREALSRRTPRAQEFWRMLERECQRLDLELEIVDHEEFLRERRNKALPDRQMVLGSIVWMVGTLPGTLDRVLHRLAAVGRPVSVLEEMGRTKAIMPRIISDSPLFLHLCLATGETAGRITGEYLFDSGHRSVAFFSLVENDEWCRRRLEGIRGVYTRAGLHSAVRSFTLGRYDSYAEIDSEILSLGPVPSLMNHLELTEKTLGIPATRNGPRLLGEVLPMMRRWYIREKLAPLLNRTLEDPSLTAWVGANDLLALVALDHLRECRIRIGRDVSVVGFDDTVEAFNNGLSSYNFNIPAIVNAMIGHITGQNRKHPGRTDGGVEIPGMVMARQSSDPPAR